MYLMIDNYDSFVHNLVCYMEELGKQILLIRNDAIRENQIEVLLDSGELEGIMISPGPKSPSDCGKSREVVERFAGRIPILGICLGHQVIGAVFGARVEKGKSPMHGKVTKIKNNQQGIFEELPKAYKVTRYHSLVVKEENLPEELVVDAVSEDGVIMAIHHRKYPIYGVQFHPEAVMTEYGHKLLENYIKICERWKASYAN